MTNVQENVGGCSIGIFVQDFVGLKDNFHNTQTIVQHSPYPKFFRKFERFQ